MAQLLLEKPHREEIKDKIKTLKNNEAPGDK